MAGQSRSLAGDRFRAIPFVEHLENSAFAQQHPAFRPIERVAIVDSFQSVPRPKPHFKDKLPSVSDSSVARVIEAGILGIGKLLVVVEGELAANRRHLGWMRVHAQSPTSDIQLVDAVVSHVTRSKVVPPVPCVVMSIRLERHHGSRANPLVVVEPSRWIGRLCMSDLAATLDVPSLRHQDISNGSIDQQLLGLHNNVVRAALRAVLNVSFIATCGLDEQTAFSDIVRTGLLDVDMLAGIRCEYRSRRVPMIGRGNDHGVEGFVVQCDPKVVDRFRLIGELADRVGDT